jgi:hypothetical protein
MAQQKQSPYDETLTKQIVAACKAYDETVSAAILKIQQGESP